MFTSPSGLAVDFLPDPFYGPVEEPGDRSAGSSFWGSGVTQETALSTGQTVAGANSDPYIIDALYSSHPWDCVVIDGRRLPGHCEILDGLTQIGIDTKKIAGKDGSTITVKGYQPGPFEIACTVWTLQQWNTLKGVIAAIWRAPDKVGKVKLGTIAVGVQHPALELLNVHSCVVSGVTFPRPGSFEGSKVIHIKCMQNTPPGPGATGTVKKAPKLPFVVPGQKRQSDLSDVMSVYPPSADKENNGPKGPIKKRR